MVKDGTLGRSAIVENNSMFCINQSVALIQFDHKKVIPGYLLAYFRDPLMLQKLKNMGKGGALKHIQITELAKLKIPLPPLETQKRIVSLLDQAQELIDKRKEQIALMDQLIQSLFYDMFGDPVSNPRNWNEAELQEVSEIKSGVTKGRNLKGKDTVFVPYMRVANVQDGYLQMDDIANIEVLPTDVSKYRLEKNDLLLTEGGDPDKLGRGAIWNGQIDNCIHQNHIFRIRLDQNLLSPEYATMLIGSPRGKRYFLKAAKQTTGIASINITQLKKCPMLIPSFDLQCRFAEHLRKVEEQKEAMAESQGKLEDNFNSLMQQAFKGELT